MHWAIDAVNFQYIGPKLAVNFQHTGVASRGIIAVNPAETRGFAAVVISLARASIPLKGAAGRNRLRTRPRGLVEAAGPDRTSRRVAGAGAGVLQPRDRAGTRARRSPQRPQRRDRAARPPAVVEPRVRAPAERWREDGHFMLCKRAKDDLDIVFYDLPV
jgi:hypothetical protein